MDASHIFSSGCAGSYHNGKGGVELGAGARVGCERISPLLSGHHHCIRAGSDPKLLDQVQAGSVPLQCVFLPLAHGDTCPQAGRLKQGGSCVQISCVLHNQSLPLNSTTPNLHRPRSQGCGVTTQGRQGPYKLNMYWG